MLIDQKISAALAGPYLLALLTTASALALQLVLGATTESTQGPLFVLFCGAVWVAAWCGGVRAGLLSTVLGALALIYLFIESKYSLRIERPQDVVLVACFIGVGWIGSLLCSGEPAAKTCAPPGTERARPRVAHLVMFFTAYVLSSGLGQGLRLIPEVAITFWPPAGIFVAALMLNPRAQWRWYVATAGLAELAGNDIWFHNSLPFALVYFAANALEALAAAWLLGRFAERPFRLDSPHQVAAFVGLAAGVAPVIGATVIATTDVLIGKHAFTTAWSLVWLGDATGLLVSAPIALAVGQAWRARHRMPWQRLLEAGAIGALLMAVAALALRDLLPTVYMTMPLVLWAAMRFQLHGAAISLALLVITSAAFTMTGAGVLAGVAEMAHDRAVMLQTFLGVTAVSGLLAASLSYRLQQANRDLERRVHERTAALGRERARLDVALRAGRTGVYEWDLRDGSLWWSAEAYSLYGVDPESSTLTQNFFLALVHPDDRDELWRKTKASVSRREVFEHEYRVVRPDGAVRWVYNHSRVEEGPEGQPSLITGVATDITERKRVEEALAQYAAALAAADQRKDAFLATLAHELRNPLATIRTNVHLLRLNMDDRAAAEQSRVRMDRQVNLLVRLIDDLLDVSRISQDKLTLLREPLDLATVVRAGLESSQPTRDGSGHAVTLTLPPGPLTVDGDSTRLAQVVGNLLTNAAKFSDPGSAIAMTLEQHGNEAVLSVRDHGIGIAPADLPRIFEMFGQIGDASHLAQGGLGIGLHLVKRLVELHGGSVQARSEGLGHGSEFVVRLPLACSAQPEQPEVHEGRQVAAPPRLRILIADDNEDSLASLALLLQHLGYEVLTASDGVKAVTAAATFSPDIVLLDLGMPLLDGYEACRRIRAQPQGAAVVLVALTGWGQDDDMRRSRAAGFDHHLVKPVSPDALDSFLRSLVPLESAAEIARDADGVA